MESCWNSMRTCKEQCRCEEWVLFFSSSILVDSTFQTKEAALIRLREELVRVRGPLPEDGEDTASQSSQDNARSLFLT